MISSAREKARNYAFLLLKFRQRSEKEIYQCLRNKKFPDPLIKETVAFLKEKAFIDDDLFAKAWMESRIKKPYGLSRLKRELSLKGISEDIIQRQAARISADYCEKDIVTKIIRQKAYKLKGIDPDKARRRIWGYLCRRGFSAEAIREAMGILCGPTQ
jgi:regulatory protein